MTLVTGQQTADHDQAAERDETAAVDTVVAVEGDIREFVRRDSASLRRTPEADSELVANNISILLQRISGSSVQEIDRLIVELKSLRDVLQQEGSRVQREIADYAHLSQAAMNSTKVIAESLGKWNNTGEWSPRTAPR